MKILLVRANPRKTGYTQRLADWFVEGVRETGASLVDVDLTTRTILPCLGCYHCWLVTPGQCVHGDDMGELLERVLEADVLVCATPVYYYSMSAHLKLFFERLLPLCEQGCVPSGCGRTRNRVRYPERWKGKSLITIITGALKEPGIFQPANDTFRCIADGIDLELGGQLTRPESYLLDYPLSKPRTLKRIQTAFREAGREAGSTGRLTPKTMEEASLPLAATPEHFRTYSNVYWTQATAMGPDGLLSAEVQQRVGTDARILIREMVRCLDPRAAARLKAVLQFDFPDVGQHFRITIDRGQCELEEAATDAPDLRISCSAAVWAQVFSRQVELREVLRDRRLVLEGDKSLFARLERIFPPPA